ncbi:AfsR/SARP family transcriptional regulator [Lentzea cavernae]|uniref:OmpR/PhoB-type domain-containing protein n=1 Tax=Lentzea cavernae TaxID=2020703 RepID=A0ABQ3MCX4_9PSEU|nr:BTAD domain-containing putative transcriptional regulator [Lentzea cavernae]GHH40139.1 hypothetical protein GCM10017774_33020 [Lentzea cavernae]
MGFQFNVLGSLEVRRDGQPVPIRAAKQRALLAALLVDANQVVPIDELMARMWDGQPPGGARNTLQNYVLRLRRTLAGADGPVTTHAAGYRINVGEGACDLHRFDALTAQARHLAGTGDASRASELLRTATGLWRAQPLLDVPSEKLQRDVVPALAEKRLDAIELRIDLDVELGRHGEVLPELRELTAAHPWRERFWAQRVLALYRAGRQGDALRCFHDVRAVLSEDLGVSPGAELTDLFQRVLAADPELLRGVPDDAAPPVVGRPRAVSDPGATTTTFIGRQEELAHLRRLLESERLITLTGACGVGKSRLVQELAVQHAGTCVVDLAAPDGSGGVGRALATALGVPVEPGGDDRAAIVEHLRGERALLVLDNCESSLDEAAEVVTGLLRALPWVRVLVTSRHRLGRPGEHVAVVAPLAVPPGDRRSPAGCESVELLLDRASAAVPGFEISQRDWHDVRVLCERLDGLPLAIELAARRLGVLSLRDAVERIDDLFSLLDDPAGPWSLRRSVDRSWNLCSESERSLWARLAVISGAFDLGEAERACVVHGVPRGDVVGLLAGLVHKSVLVADTSGLRARYRMLGVLREYGRLRSADLVPPVTAPRLRSVGDR